MSDSKQGLRNVARASEVSRRKLLLGTATTAIVAGGGLLVSSPGVNAAPGAFVEPLALAPPPWQAADGIDVAPLLL